MEPQIIKNKPLSKDESKALLELIEMSKIIISKATNASSNKMKDKEWVRIAEQFNATATSCRRTPQQLRLKWENLKKNARKRCTKIRMNNINTGGGVGKRKLQGDGSKSARDRAIAEYYTFKKLCLESKLENKKLKLENEKLLLEIENFKK
ncbi:unnamed protein product [Parnassius apollo]|uniref:Regulatory protein zeste n=1 Tax=Parnassius apollo TaxID=110799 RepID=A0A8S3WF46_PARAO|nr:unnamed protein product [Parnassius apollo]